VRLTKNQKRAKRLSRNDATWGDMLGPDGRRAVRKEIER